MTSARSSSVPASFADAASLHRCVDWRQCCEPRLVIGRDATVEEAHAFMLSHGYNFAAVADGDGQICGMACFKRVAAVLSAKFGLAVFAKKPLEEVRVHPKLLGFAEMSAGDSDHLESLMLRPESVALLLPEDDLFIAQRILEMRSPERYFDDFVVVDERRAYAGMLSVRDLHRMLFEIVEQQETQLVERNAHLVDTVQRLSRAQGELINAAKMASLGELVAGIAHEMNTPLGVLLSSQDVLTKVFALLSQPEVSDEKRRQWMNLVRTNLELGEEASKRVSRIVQSLRTFGRADQEQFHCADLADLIEGTLVLLSNRFKSGVSVETHFPDAAALFCHPGQLSQVFINILTNAYQAVHGEGRIEMHIAPIPSGWQVRVRDSGPGIPEASLERIFDPGYTTKGVGVGTGLGLSISRKIVELHHRGRIYARNPRGGGAEFVVELPAHPLESPLPLAHAARPSPAASPSLPLAATLG